MAELPHIHEWLQASGLLARKALGQHFLLQPTFPHKIAAVAGDATAHHIIEVGPGPTVLTRALLEKTNAAHVTAIEMDERFVPLLEMLKGAYPDRFSYLREDALKVNAMQLAPADGPRMVVANLPYNVGTEMLLGWLLQIAEHGPNAYTKLVLMFQKEVVDRITASPRSKAYGRLSVLAQWLCQTTEAIFVPAGAFSPPPKVDSAVALLEPYSFEQRLKADSTAMQRVTKAAFGQRRKMLRGALKSLCAQPEALLETAQIDPTARAETLSVEDFVRLANAYSALTKS